MIIKQVAKWTLVSCVAVALCSTAALADNEKGTAVIKGKVTFEGTPPKPKPLAIAGDNHCVQKNTTPVADQGTIIYSKDGNTIPYVFVYVKNGVKGKYTPPANPVVIDQSGCMYHPHIFGMIAGQAIDIKNSDSTNHNIHSLAKKNPTFNFAQAQQGMVKNLTGNDTFTREEIMVKIKCDVHAWMSTYVGVLTHPFFDVTKSHSGPGGDGTDGGDKSKRGTFEIKELPAGEYEIEAWHENFGTMTQKVAVKDGETKEIEFKFGAKKAEAPTPTRTVILGAETGAEKK